MFTSHRERLARWSSGNYRNLLSERTELEAPRIDLVHRTPLDRVGVMTLVLTEGFSCVVVPFDDGCMLKSGIRHADGESPRAGEKFNATHQEIPLYSSVLLWFIRTSPA